MANKDLMAKGIKYIAGAIPLMFIGPTIIYNAFMNQHINWHYLVLIVGIILCAVSMYLMFSGLKIIMKGIFND
ncbi:DUF6095 family protein [Flavobacterium aquiphilum]|uniref:DUF6095 family protein n=1 Tax=Flavobacterium aquiphilum TaxID=3003261 RepID=UPI002480561E|nr:DUF6095 family protein [Flavobacterium aquiphilum]